MLHANYKTHLEERINHFWLLIIDVTDILIFKKDLIFSADRSIAQQI